MPGDLLFVRGDCLVDPRLFAVLLARTAPHWFTNTTDHYGSPPAAARLSPAQLDTWATAGLEQWLQNSPVLKPEMLDDYSPAHRGPVPFYVRTVTTPEDARGRDADPDPRGPKMCPGSASPRCSIRCSKIVSFSGCATHVLLRTR